MIETSALYKSIIAGPHEFEWKVEINTAAYSYTKMVRSTSGDCVARITRQTFPNRSPSVGNCLSSEFSVVLLEPSYNIPRLGSVHPYFRAVSSQGVYSEWIQAGVYFIDQRRYDEGTGTTALTCYDAMLKTDGPEGNSYYDLTHIASWPASASSVVADIASIIGVSVDSRTVINSNFLVEDPESLTMREVLGGIAAEHCGNWIITSEGKLRLVPLCGDDTDTIEVDSAAENIEIMPPQPEWSKVILVKDNNTRYLSGDDTGIALTAESPWASQIKAHYMLSVIDGIAYQPFSASNAFVDPATEIGDKVTFTSGGVAKSSHIWSIDLSCDNDSVSTIAASGGDEFNHEYPYIPPARRRIRKVEKDLEALEESIPSKIEETLGVTIIRAKILDFSGWDSGFFVETLDDDSVIVYTVTFDNDGRPITITDGDHTCDVIWESENAI